MISVQCTLYMLLSIYIFRDPKGGEKELIQDFSYFKIQAAFDAQIDRYPLLNYR